MTIVTGQADVPRRSAAERNSLPGKIWVHRADYAYVLQVGRGALEGPAKELAGNAEVQRVYLGIG